MKKFLSLVLALIMTMSLVTISAGAKDFADDEKITYDEAVAVISTIGVVDGYADGSFNPQGSLTRGAAAKIICNMILGPTTAAELHADTAPYKDVPTNHTFAGYIAYCAKEGIISGYADGTFRPAGTLTGYAFMKMLLGALGYDAAIEGYTGANWSINVAKQALNVGLNKSLEGDFNGIKAVNREEAALYAFNTLKSDLVEYDTTISTTINGQTVTIGNSIAKAQKWNNSATRINNIKSDEYIQFAEQYFNKLVLDETEDAFGRPSREWSWKGEEIGTYVNHDLLVAEFTEKVVGKDLYDVLGKSVLEDKDYDIDVYVDGETTESVLGKDAYFTAADMNKNNKGKVGETGDGVLTQVYLNSDAKEVDVCVINTYLARAKADYNEKKDTVSFTVYKIDGKGADKNQYVKTAGKDSSMPVSGDDFDIEEIKEKDAYLVTVAEGEIQTLTKAEVLGDSTLTAFSKDSYVITDGTKYEYADTLRYDPTVLEEWTNVAINLKEKSYNLYLDPYGFLIGIDLVDEDDNYVFITGIDSSASNLNATNIKANAIFVDGTMETITISTKKSTGTFRSVAEPALLNRWFTYTVSKDGVYSVDEINDQITAPKGSGVTTHPSKKLAQYASKDSVATPIDIDVKHVSLPGQSGTGNYAKVYGNDKTVYLTAEVETINTNTTKTMKGIISDVTNVTTGIKNASLTTYTQAQAMAEADKNAKVKSGTAIDAAYGAYTLYKSNGYIIATVVVGEDNAASKNLVYVTNSDVDLEEYSDANDEWTWTREVIYNGVETELKEVGDKLTYLSQMQKYNWYQVKFNAKDEVIGVELAETALNHTNAALGNEYVDNASWIELAINAKDNVLFEKSDYNKETPAHSVATNAAHNQPVVPYLVGGTFYVITSDKTGFRVNDDVKYVFIQENNNKTTTTVDEGIENLEDVVEELNKASDDGMYDYEVSAILENGAATVVVIRDLNNDGYKVVRPSTDDHTVTASYDGFHTFTITIDDGCTPNNVEVADAIKAELTGSKWNASDVTVKYDANDVTEVSFITANGTPMLLTKSSGNLTVKFALKLVVNGKTVDGIIASDGTLTNAQKLTEIASDAGISDTGTYAKITNHAGKSRYEAVSSASIKAGDAEVEFGYVELTGISLGGNIASNWTITDSPLVGASGAVYVAKGDKFEVVVEYDTPTAWGETDFNNYTWTTTTTGVTATAELTTIGTASTKPAVTFTVEITSVATDVAPALSC